MKIKKVYLYISTWAGISLGAQHWYGQLKIRSIYNEPDIDLTRTLTAKQAARANRYLSLDKSLRRLKAGDESAGFDSKDEIRQ